MALAALFVPGVAENLFAQPATIVRAFIVEVQLLPNAFD
jgi:hypothetical protein